MIHTSEFHVRLNIDSDIEVIKKLEEQRIIRKGSIVMMLKNIPLQFGYDYRLYIFVDYIKLLGRPDITPKDINKILEKINESVRTILNRSFELELNRIDYRYDVVIPSKKERSLLVKLLKKGPNKSCYMEKINKYKEGVRYFAKSKTNNIYDKENERHDVGEEVKDYEKKVFRFEAQVKKPHLRYKKTKYDIQLELEEYFTFEKYKEYMGKMIIKTVGKGDFYNFYHAKKIINNSSIKEKYKKELIKFLNHTSKKRSLSKTKEEFGRYKYEMYINMLEELGVNPILIPEKEKVTYLSNPLKELITLFEEN
ncbi:MAG: hypothetical protein E7212_10330 [Clostridium sartagoforme]|nr:hypothetical protein [Clostridium sartagoforme]